MENKKEMTIPNVSAATDTEQSLSKCTDNSIVNQNMDFKGYEQTFEETQNEILNSTVRLCGGIYSNTVDIYYFI